MKKLIEQIEDRLFQAADSVCLDRAQRVTEAYARYDGLPAPILRARAFEHILLNMKLDLVSNPVFAGNTSSAPRAWMLCPEFGLVGDIQVGIEHAELKDFLVDKIPDGIRLFWQGRHFGGNAGIGHMSLDFDRVVNQGLDRVLSSLQSPRPDLSPEQETFREAMSISCQAVIRWAGRYAEEAEQMAQRSEDPLVAACLRRVSAACRHVPAKPARNLFEGLQAIALVHLASVLEGQGMSMSIGQ